MVGVQVVIAAVACVVLPCLAAQLHVSADAEIVNAGGQPKRIQRVEAPTPCEKDEEEEPLEIPFVPLTRPPEPLHSIPENLTVYDRPLFGGSRDTTTTTTDSSELARKKLDQPHAPTHTIGGRDVFFDCALTADWRHQWSMRKLMFCCAKYGIGCETAHLSWENREDVRYPFGPEEQKAEEKPPPPLLRKDEGIWPAPNQWVCGLLCQAHAKDGCCGWTTNTGAKSLKSDIHSGGFCEFREGTFDPSPNEGWQSATCESGFETAKCFNWVPGRCVDKFLTEASQSNSTSIGPSNLTEAANLGLPIWDLVWEDQFDADSCILDDNGIFRPNPAFWTYEQGYKRGKEKQWYSPSAVKCEDGALVITAKQMKPLPPENASCQLRNYDATPPNPTLNSTSCQACGSPTLEYGEPCNLAQADGSGAPACDCFDSAEFISGSVMTKGKKEFSYGLFELKAKIKSRPGAWPSWWAVGDFEESWPKNGEIDILDAFGHMVKSSIVHADSTGAAITHAAARAIDSSFENYWHTWQLEWDEKEIIVRIDTWEMFRLDLKAADNAGIANPFNSRKSFFMILNLAVGGHRGGDIGVKPWPQDGLEFQIDHVRHMVKRGHTHPNSTQTHATGIDLHTQPTEQVSAMMSR